MTKHRKPAATEHGTRSNTQQVCALQAGLWSLLRAAVVPLALAGCSEPPVHHYRALVIAQSDPGVALPGVAIEHAGQVVGKTDARGALPLQFVGEPGERIPLDVRCPANFHQEGAPLELTLRTLADGEALPEYRTQCRPELRSLVVAVRSHKGASVPVRYLNREIARTDSAGAAHALLKVPAGETVKVVLDTTGPQHRYLRPQNPELQITVPDRDDVVLFDQPFVVAEPKRPAPVVIPLPDRF